MLVHRHRACVAGAPRVSAVEFRGREELWRYLSILGPGSRTVSTRPRLPVDC